MIRLAGVAALLAVVSSASAAAAQPAKGDDETDDDASVATAEPARRVRPLAVAASIIPGVLIAGSGHYVAGDKDTAKTLLELQGLGLALGAGAGIPLALTASARQISGPLIPVGVLGASLLFAAWAADIYGTAGGANIGGSPKPPRALELELGYAHVVDPQFDYASFAVVIADLRRGPWRVSPSAWIAVDADNQRLRAEGAYRLRGPIAGPDVTDGSFIDAYTALTYHRYGDERFSVATAEAAVNGRYDMARLSSSLGGSFMELGVGFGIDVTNYYTTNAGRDVSDILLTTSAFGIYLSRGELRLGYDHRRDTLAGGLATPAQTNGFLGYYFVDALWELTERWAAVGEISVGSAYIANIGVRYRGTP